MPRPLVPAVAQALYERVHLLNALLAMLDLAWDTSFPFWRRSTLRPDRMIGDAL